MTKVSGMYQPIISLPIWGCRRAISIITLEIRVTSSLKFLKEGSEVILLDNIKNNKKLLGICYGAEILALTLGGTIRKIESVQKGDEKIEILQDNFIVNNSLNVFESHGYEISKLPDMLIPIGKSNNCKYEIIQHKEKPIFGTQFHPEMSLDGNDLIEHFCSL